jgi:ligand-binding sensor domain-containing protein/signal transduction histidine kinase/DNA-binding response OmpR family regulator
MIFRDPRSLFLALLFVLPGGVHRVCAQTQDFRFQHITIEQGLSQSTVYAVVQDTSGFMWFGTRDGLNRYDSRKIRTYRHDLEKEHSISDNTIFSLYIDSRSRFWVGTNQGLNLYDPRTDGFTRIMLQEGGKPTTSPLAGNAVACMLEDRQKNLWIGTRNGLNVLKAGSTSFSFLRFTHADQEANSLPHNDVRSILEDSEGNLWVGTSAGLSKITTGQNGTYHFTSYQVPEWKPTASKTNEINSIVGDGKGALLIATENSGLLSFDPKTEQFRSLDWIGKPDEAVRVILRDKRTQDYWIGTIGGVYKINPEQGKFISLRNIPDDPGSVSDNSVRSLYADRDGSIWIGTFHGGVNMYSALSRQFQQVVQEGKLHFKVASALVADTDNNVWLATEGNGLFFTNRRSGVTRHFKHLQDDPRSLSHNNVKCLLPDGHKGLWVGTLKGLSYYDFKTDKFTTFHHQPGHANSLPDDAVYDLVQDRDGAIWIATYRGGLCKFDPHKDKFETFVPDPQDSTTLSSDGVTRLLLDTHQNLWVGTITGLNVKASDQNSFRRYIHDPADTTTLSNNYILCVFEDRRHRIWVGTRDNGLNLLLPGQRGFKRFKMQQGLPGNTIYGIQEDRNGYLWISTDNGLSKLNPVDFSVHNFDRNDGLVCKQFNFNSYCKDGSGTMYFGGYNGVVVFSPEGISGNQIVPNVTFVNFKLFNKEIPVDPAQGILEQDLNYTRELTMGYDQNIFSIEFAVLNYINSAKNQFAYKLAGFEEQWNITPEPVATYMNLNPGSYTLLVKGSNNDGLWNETPVSIKLKILPPPWKSWWAYSIYVGIFLALLYAWSRFHKKRMKLEHDLEIEHLEHKKQEELHQAKLSFFANIVHEIRTPLTLMTGPVEKLLEQYTGDVFLKKELSLVHSNTNRLQRLLNQLLDFHKQETGNVRLKVHEENIVEFIDEIQLSFQEYAQSRKVTLDFHPQEPVLKLWFDREELSKVFYNLLVNAFKFTPGGGTVSIAISREPELPGTDDFKVRITMEDNGLGIPALYLEKVFHRFYQAENSGMNGAGVGIGLALAKGIIDLHHGSVVVESKEATSDATGFTRFTMLLPSGCTHFSTDQILPKSEADGYRCHDTVPENHASAEETAGKKQASHDKPLVLVVEDNDEIRAFVRDTLLPYYQVTESANGLQGLEIAVEQLPDLILSDVMMPRMDGLELVHKLKADPRTSHIPVILLTARGALNYKLEGFETGADDYLTKPVEIRLLLVKIKTHLRIREKLKEKYSRIVTLQPQDQEVENPDDKFLQKLMSALEENITNAEFNVTKLVREIGMSRPVLFRKVKMLTGLSVIDMIRNVRLKKAEMLLKQKKLSISEVAFTVGFSDPKYFSKSFRNHYGKSPSEYLEELS